MEDYFPITNDYISEVCERYMKLKENPEKFNSEKGWGSYEGLCNFTKDYLTTLLNIDNLDNYKIYASV